MHIRDTLVSSLIFVPSGIPSYSNIYNLYKNSSKKTDMA